MNNYLVDNTLRDGNHTINNKFTADDVYKICKSLDQAKVDFIEIGYSLGINSHNINSAGDDVVLYEAAESAVSFSKILLFAFAKNVNKHVLKNFKNVGANYIRIAVDKKNLEITSEAIKIAKNLGYYTGAFYTMAHQYNTNQLLEVSKSLYNLGVDSFTITDSAGTMTPHEVSKLVHLLNTNFDLPVGFHGHDNLGLSVANSLEAIDSGAKFIDCALSGLGAGAGNTTTEIIAAINERIDLGFGINFFKSLDASQVLRNIINNYGIDKEPVEENIIVGYYGIYSALLNYAKELSHELGISYVDVIKIIAENSFSPNEKEEIKLEALKFI